MRSRHAITVGILALGTVAGTGLAAHADSTVPDTTPASAMRGGIDGYRVVMETGTTTATATCTRNNQRVIGGGALAGTVAAPLPLAGTFPTTDRRGWTGLAVTVGTPVTVWAICAEVDD
jgi:hypothetical protein